MNRNLSLLLGGQLISQIGDKFHMLAVAFLVLKTTGSPAKMGLVLFCSVFPAMFLGFIAGAFLDRHSRKMIIVGADVIRGLIVAALGALYYLNALSFAALLVAQLLISVCTAFFRSCHSSHYPSNCQTRSINPGQLPDTICKRHCNDYRTDFRWSHGGLGGILRCFFD